MIQQPPPRRHHSSSSRHSSSSSRRQHLAPPPPPPTSGRSNSRMMDEIVSASSGASAPSTGGGGAASRRRNMAFMKYGSEGSHKRSASSMNKTREHARQIAHATSSRSSSKGGGGSISGGGGADDISDSNSFLAEKIHRASLAAAKTPSAASSSSHHHKKSSSSSSRRRGESRTISSSRQHHATDASTSAEAFADFGAAFASSTSSSSPKPPQPALSDMDTSLHSEASSALSFFAEDPFANVREEDGVISSSNNSHSQQPSSRTSSSREKSSSSSSSRRGENSTRASANTREKKNQLDAFTSGAGSRSATKSSRGGATTAAATGSSRHTGADSRTTRRQEAALGGMQGSNMADWAAHEASLSRSERKARGKNEILAAISPRSMSTMPSNSSMQTAFVNQQQHAHESQAAARTPTSSRDVARTASNVSLASAGDHSFHSTGSTSPAPMTGAVARRKMRSQTKMMKAQQQQQAAAAARTPPHSPYSSVKRHQSSDTLGSTYALQKQHSSTNRSVSSHRSAESLAAASTAGSSAGSGSSVNLFSQPAQNGGAAQKHHGGFSFDAFGLDASQMNAQVNQAMHDLAGTHPDLSFFVEADDEFASGRWDSSSPTVSRSSTPPPPNANNNTSSGHNRNNSALTESSTGAADDMDDDGDGFVDGFRVTKQSLPVHIRNSPGNSERSSLTSESSANNNPNAGGSGGGGNLFKEKASFSSSKRPRKFVRPSERVDEATSPKSKNSLGSPLRSATHDHFHFQSPSQQSANATSRKRQDAFTKPSHLPNMPDLDNSAHSRNSHPQRRSNSKHMGTIQNSFAAPESPSSASGDPRNRPRREDVQFVDVNSDSDFSAGGGAVNAKKTVASTMSAVEQQAATPGLKMKSTSSSGHVPAPGRSGGTGSSTAPSSEAGTRSTTTASAASRMTQRLGTTPQGRIVASLRQNTSVAASLLPNNRSPKQPNLTPEEEQHYYQEHPHERAVRSALEASSLSNRARSEVNIAASSRPYSDVNSPWSRRAYSDVNATASSRAHSDQNSAYAASDSRSNIPSDVGVASDVGPPPSTVGAAFENIPKEVASKEKQRKKGSADTATTETSSVMQFEEKKEEELSTPGTPEKTMGVGNLRARWEKSESTSVDTKPTTPTTSRPSLVPSPLNREHIEQLQNQLHEERTTVQQRKPESGFRSGPKSPHIRRAEQRAQQQPSYMNHRSRLASNGDEQPSLQQHSSPVSGQQRYGMKNTSKSEGGAAHTRFRPSHINAAINRVQISPQSSAGTPRDAKSDTGTPSPEFFKVKLRKTVTAKKESPRVADDNDETDTAPTNSMKPPLSPKASNQYKRQSPESPARSSSSHAEEPPTPSSQPEEPPERKMTYKERRELELQKKREEELRQEEEQRANAKPKHDVASLIKKRIAAANKKTGDGSMPSPRQSTTAALPPKPYARTSSQRELSPGPVGRESSPKQYAGEPSPRQNSNSLPSMLAERQSSLRSSPDSPRSRSKGFDHSDSRDLSIEDVSPSTETESAKPSAAVSRLLMLQQLQSRIPPEPSSAGRQTVASPRPDATAGEDHHHKSLSTPKATKMMLNAFLAGRDSIASGDGTSHAAETLGEGYPDEHTAVPMSTLPALKDDPNYERYFKMLKLGMPMEVVKHAMIRDGLDPAIMDGDPNKPAMVGIPLKDDPTYQKYFKMLKIGMPMEAVKHAMLRDGHDCSVMDQDHNLPVQKRSEDDDDEPKEKDSHRRARLHWKTLRKVTSNSLWAKLNQEVAFNDIEIDEDEFQQLFQAERGEAPAPKTTSNVVGRGGVSVRVIDPKRANNGGIILARLKMSHDDMADAVDRINEHALTAEQIEHIIEFLPSKEERKALESYMLEGGQDAAEKFDGLCECEKFMVSMMTVKHAKRKVRALLFKLQFESCLDDILQDTLAVEAACDELSNSIRLRQLLGIILTFGNRLNTAGNKKRKAGAFTLDSLLKLNQAKAFDKKTTFLHYIILIVQRNNELLLRFKDDLPTVFKADKVFWDQCLSDLEEVESQLENVRKIALHQARQSHSYRLRRRKQRDDDEESLSDDDVSLSLEEEVEALRATPIGMFTLSAIKYASSLRDKVEETQGKLYRLLEYFGEEDKNMPSHELFSTIVSFSREFDKAKEQVFSNEKKKMREERKHKSIHASKSPNGKPPTHSPAPPSERKMMKASSHQPTISGVMRAKQRAARSSEPPGAVTQKSDSYIDRSSVVDPPRQRPVVEAENDASYHHRSSTMDSAYQTSVATEDASDYLDSATGMHDNSRHEDEVIASCQQPSFQPSSSSEHHDKAPSDEGSSRPLETRPSDEDIGPRPQERQTGRESPVPQTPIRRPGPDAPSTPNGYHRVETPKTSRRQQKVGAVPNEESPKPVGRSSPSVCSESSSTRASMRERARMRRRRKSSAHSTASSSVEQPKEPRSAIQSPPPSSQEAPQEVSSPPPAARDLSPDPSDTVSQSSTSAGGVSSTMSPRSTFRHRRRMEVRDRLRQKAGQ